mgnify:CR=1 FL=1
MNTITHQILLEIPVDATSGEINLDNDKKIVWRIINKKEKPVQYNTSLGQKLGNIRNKFLSSGANLLDRDSLDQEIARCKGRRDEENLH